MSGYLEILIGITLFVLGLRKLPATFHKLTDRIKNSNLVEMNGVITPYIVGIILSILFQSSSIAIIFIMIFMVYARIQFHSAFAYMLGATLGTSLKFWIYTPDMKLVAVSLILISQASFLFLKTYRFKSHLMAISWIGLMFLGWSIFKDGTHSLLLFHKTDLFEYLSTKGSTIELYSAGTLVTALLQSSTQVIAFASKTMMKAGSDLYNVGLVTLGANVGTTITAILISIWLPIKAKRLAFAHFGIQLLGTMLCFVTYQTFLSTIDNILITPLNLKNGDTILALHTGFNFFNSIIFIGLFPVIDKIMSTIIRDKKDLDIDDDTFLTKSLIQLLSNVPKEGLQESKKQFKKISFSIKAFEDQLVKSLTNPGIRKQISDHANSIISQMRSNEELLLIIRHKHTKYSKEAHQLLIDFYRLRKILRRVDDLNEYIQNFSREELNDSMSLLKEFLEQWIEYRSIVWNNIFEGQEADKYAPLSQSMSRDFLKGHGETTKIRPHTLTSSYRIGIFLISLSESWELLWRHQTFEKRK